MTPGWPGHCLPVQPVTVITRERRASEQSDSLTLLARHTLLRGPQQGWKFAVCILRGFELLVLPGGRKAQMRSLCYWVRDATQFLRVEGRAWKTAAHA